MCKTNSFHNRLYVLLSFVYVLFSFGLRSFHLVMRSLHLSYALFSFGYVFFPFRYVIILFGYALFSFGYVLFSFRYVLFPFFALFMRSFYVIFLCALFMCSFYALFLACQDCRSFIIANAFQWYGQPTVAVNCPKYNQVPLDKFMVSVNMPEVICSFYVIHPSFKPTSPSRLNTSLADAIHAISKSVTLNDYSPPFQKFPQNSLATKWIIVC